MGTATILVPEPSEFRSLQISQQPPPRPRPGCSDAAALWSRRRTGSTSLPLGPTVSGSVRPGGQRSARLGTCADVPGARDRIDGAAWRGAGRRD